jgi:hypothetical protein
MIAAAVILAIVVTLAALAVPGILWPHQLIRTGLWLQQLETHDEPEPPVTQDSGLPFGRHARSAPRRAPQAGAVQADAPSPRGGRPPWDDASEPAGWPVFATSTDMPVIMDTRVVPPYVLPRGRR